MDSDTLRFRPEDDSAFVRMVTEKLSLGAAAKRRLSEQDYIRLAREKWASCNTDEVYAIKLLIDPLVEPQYADESSEEIFCVLVARIAPDGELIDAPPGYQPPSFPGVRLSHIVAGSPSGGRVPDPAEPAEYLLAYFDVLGFEALLNRIGLHELNRLYSQLLDTALTPYSEARPWSRALSMVQGDLAPALMWLPIETAYFSDSILLWVPYHPGHVHEFLHRCSRVFCEALGLGLPIRGTVTAGKAVLNKKKSTFLGQPLVEAARFEPKLNWIGVALGASIKSEELKIPFPPDMVLLYTPPMKPGGEQLFSDLVLDWPRVWRETRHDSAIDHLQSLCTSDLSPEIQKRYRGAIAFFNHSEANQNWFLPPGGKIIKA